MSNELKVEVELVADSVVDRVRRKAGDKVLVPASLADAFGKGTPMTPELRKERVAKQEEQQAAADKKVDDASKKALAEARKEQAEAKKDAA